MLLANYAEYGLGWGRDHMLQYENDTTYNWHERAAFQQSAFGRSTAGNDVVATIFISLFFFFPFFFSPSRPFLIEGVVGSKNLFSKSCLERPKT